MARSIKEVPPQETDQKTTKSTTKKSASATKKATKSTAKKTTKKQTINPLPTLEPAYTPSQAEKMCKGISPALRQQAITLAESILTLQKKIEQQTPIYETEPLIQEVTVGTGEKILRSNPFVQEFRATVRDYSAALKSFKELCDVKGKPQESSPLDTLKSRYRIS